MSKYARSVGAEFLVNTTTTSDQYESTITALSNGGFVVSWTNAGSGNGDPGYSITAQIYDASGEPVGTEFRVNTETTYVQYRPTISGLSNGGFVVSWQDHSDLSADTDGSAIMAQVYDASGGRVGGEFLVNTEMASYQDGATVTGLSNGGFVISWTDTSGLGSDSSHSGIKTQIYDASGARVGGEFLVNTETSSYQQQTSITSLSNGGFVVTWADFSQQGGDTSGSGIKAQIFDAAGARVGSEFLVNTATVYSQDAPAITSLSNGGFVVTWTDPSGTGADTSGAGIKAQIYDASGAEVGDELLVNTQISYYQKNPAIVGLSTGGFVVCWIDEAGFGADPSDQGIKGQAFDSAGNRVGTEFLVNTQTTSSQIDPAITALSNGQFVVSWTDKSGLGADSSGSGIKAQIFELATAPTVALTGKVAIFAENASTLAHIKVADIAVSDAPAGSVLSLSGADAALFQIVGTSLYLKAGAKLDFETNPKLDVIVNLDDPARAGIEASKAMVIAVTNVNEAPKVSLTDALTALAENVSTASGGPVANVVVSDDALGTEVLTLSGADAAMFQIKGSTLFLKAGAKLDFETNPTLDVTVNVDDKTIGSGIDAKASLSIAVRDVVEVIKGTSAANVLTGTNATEVINGYAGNDRISGAGGNDRINGGAGVDILTGGKGADVFIFAAKESGSGYSGFVGGSKSFNPASGQGKRDIITDFAPGSDKINLSAIDANVKTSGDQAFSWKAGAAFSKKPGELTFKAFNAAGTANDKTIIYGDTDGNGLADFQIELTGLKALTNGDFVL